MYDFEHLPAPASTPTLQDDGYQPETDAQDLFGNAALVASIGEYGGGMTQEEALRKYRIPIAHDGWSKGDDGWQADPSVKTPLSGKTHARGEAYANEAESATFRFNESPRELDPWLDTKDGSCTRVRTRMMGDEEASKHALSVKDGRLMQKGAPLDTEKATGKGTYDNGGVGRYIYAKGADGETRALDPWANHLEDPYNGASGRGDGEGPYGGAVRLDEAKVPEGKKGVSLDLVNHSTLLDGRDARGAGEIRADEGRNVILSDRSGHYRPDNEMLYDSVRGLVDQGLPPEATTVEMTDKSPGAKGTGLLRQGLKEPMPWSPHQGALQVGALEFMSYGGNVGAEQQMRDARAAREPLHDDIEGFDRSSLKPTTTRDRSAPRLEKMGDAIFRGDAPSVRSRARRFGA